MKQRYEIEIFHLKKNWTVWKLNGDKKLKPEIGLWSWAICVEVWAYKD
jgi:hypothetical protein